MKKFFTILLLINLFINNANSIEADVFVQSTVNRASEILSKNISKEKKMDQLKIIATETVDIEGIGYYSLGSARNQLNDIEKEEFSKFFRKYFLKSLISRLTDYSSSKFDILDADKKSSNYTIVSSKITPGDGGPEVKIDWRIYTKNSDNPLIRDLIIEGLSLARTQKEEFSSILNSNDGDINALFKTLEEFSKN